MIKRKWKTTIVGGIFQDDSISKWWYYYFGGKNSTQMYSGNFPTERQAREALEAQFQQAIIQYSDNWEVAIERKGSLKKSSRSW